MTNYVFCVFRGVQVKRAILSICFLVLAATLPVKAQDIDTPVVYRSDDGSVFVKDLGKGVHLFHYTPDFYVSPFVIGDNAVIAVDPVNRNVAELYRAAVAALTDKPITKIIYSHDHRDHIVGADVLSPDAKIYAHPGTRSSLEERGDVDIPLPSKFVEDGDKVKVKGAQVRIHYFGPNHGYSNIALSFDAGIGSVLVWVDTLEIGIVPYRTLPDTNVRGYLTSLRLAAELDVDWVIGGHSGPGPGIWIENYLNYFLDMEKALRKAQAEIPPPAFTDVDQVFAQGEEHIAAVIAAAVDEMRPKYGKWMGFEQWAPLNAEAVRAYIIVGN